MVEAEIKYCNKGHIRNRKRRNSKYLECRICSAERSRKSRRKLQKNNHQEYLRRKKIGNKKYYNPQKNHDNKQLKYYLFNMQKQAIEFVIEPILIEEITITEYPRGNAQ